MEITHHEIRTKTVDIPYRGEVIEVTYKPSAFTYRLLLMMAQNQAKAIAAWMVAAIVDWSITRDGEPVVPSAATIFALPAEIASTISAALMVDMALIEPEDVSDTE